MSQRKHRRDVCNRLLLAQPRWFSSVPRSARMRNPDRCGLRCRVIFIWESQRARKRERRMDASVANKEDVAMTRKYGLRTRCFATSIGQAYIRVTRRYAHSYANVVLARDVNESPRVVAAKSSVTVNALTSSLAVAIYMISKFCVKYR